MNGERITIAAEDGGNFQAYLAKPASGSGPGLVLCQEIFGVNDHIRGLADHYAEEGYVVACPDLFWRLEPRVSLTYEGADREKAFALGAKIDIDAAVRDVAATVAALRKQPAVKGKIGTVGFCLGGRLSVLAAARAGVDCAVSYYAVSLEQHTDEIAQIAVPMVLHFGETDPLTPPPVIDTVRQAAAGKADIEIYVYPGAGHAFNRPGPNCNKSAAGMAHSRTIALLRKVMGPHYDLSTLWQEHATQEFAHRDADATMHTMVAKPYVNHVPTMTGGYGHKHLHRFYKHHFIPTTPTDAKLIPISRTIGADRVVDEILFCFTHTAEIEWMLPGIPPTGKYVEIPLVAIINFRGDKLYNEHIYWDQASVLVQIGKLDPKGLPVAGVETARKIVDPSLPSNTLMPGWSRSENLK